MLEKEKVDRITKLSEDGKLTPEEILDYLSALKYLDKVMMDIIENHTSKYKGLFIMGDDT